MEKVLMPKLGMAQSYCVIEKWHKKEGDKINEGDILAEVSTDKINYEIEAKASGYLIKIVRGEKEEVPARDVIALIGNKNEKGHDFAEDKREEDKSSSGSTKVQQDNNLKVTLLAKKLIEKNKLDVTEIKGTGPGGRILKEDVLKFMSEDKTKKEIKEKGKIVPEDYKKDMVFDVLDIKINREEDLKGIRKTISDKMVYAVQNTPHITQSSKADVTELMNIMEKLKILYKKISLMDFIIKVTALALRENLELNSSLINNKFVVYDDINIGIVTSIPEGLIIPVIHNCDKLTLFEIAEQRKQLIKRAMENKLNTDDISNGTFTITNLGMFNVRSCTAIIYPPQGSILTLGTVYSNPEAIGNNIEIRKVIELSITEDHRILDGVSGAKFLNKAVELFENPSSITEIE
ncbi:MAG: dihydrolipoamide acetyltransferase family protein [Actinomycetota bacterium]|nr:dihydrolipoamide acetyltransferase family protein [Actinomycetota bacterium]